MGMKAHRKALWSFAVALLLAAGMLAPSAEAQVPAHWPRSVMVGTASIGGTFFIYGGGWANLIQEKLGVAASIEVTGGPNHNMVLIQAKELDLGMVTMGPAWEAWNGEGDWTGGVQHRDVRALFPMYTTPFHFWALKRTGIASTDDIHGKIVGVGPAGGTPGTYFPRFFDLLGINVTVRHAGISDLASQQMDGLIDVIAFAAGLPVAAAMEVEAQHPVNFFGFTEEEIAKIVEAYPYFSRYVIPAGTYETQTEDMTTVAIWNMAVGHKDLPEDFVYAIVKTVHENHQYMLETHAAAKETLPENVVNNEFLWMHPGAIRYYREIGIEIPEHLYPPEYRP